MEKTMRCLTIVLLMVLLGGTNGLAAAEKVETRGITSEVKIEEVIFGHLTELNGRFKLRATELTFAPDGYDVSVRPVRTHRCRFNMTRTEIDPP
jgi:hypothetical protein